MPHAASTSRLLLVLLAGATAHAQLPSAKRSAPVAGPASPTSTASPASQAPDPTVIFLDPAHGGADDGSHLAAGALEKDATLALALSLRGLLAGRGFKVILTRTSAADNASEAERIDLAQRSRPSACLLLHASNGGHGVHLYISSLTGAPAVAHTRAEGDGTILPWDTTQAASLPASLDLESDLATALNGIEIPLVSGRASVSPIDSIACPAVAIELAPYTPDGGTPAQPSDPAYQERVARAIAEAIVFRRDHLTAGKSNGGAGKAKPTSKAKPSNPNPHPAAKPPAPATKDASPHKAPASPPSTAQPHAVTS